MTRASFLSLATLLLPGMSAGAGPDFATDVTPFLAKHCLECHAMDKKKGDLALDGYATAAAAAKDRDVWAEVAKKLRAREMPPKAKPAPAAAEVEKVLAWIDAGVFGVAPGGKADPGRVTMRRLNRYEYNYTTRDLTGVDLQLGDDFPADDLGYGFDNIGDVLTTSPLLAERYIAAAGKIAERAIVAAPPKDRKKAKLPGSHRAIIFEEPKSKSQWKATARKVLERFASRAYRRPATAGELDRLVRFVDLAGKQGDTFERGIQVAVQAVLASPHFLFRVELDGDPRSGEARPITDWQLASRLSYFLWSSMPDEELSEHARKGTLRKDGNLEAQVKRMIRDGKSRGLLKTFSALWLGSRAMKEASPDPARFPKFDEDLRQAMRTETERFFEEVMRKDLSVLTFLDADFTFLNEKLARHYGIDGVKGKEFRRVKVTGGERGGVLTQGTVLTVTSNPTRTSPVKRGRWILEQILGAPPPPPPPGQDVLKDEGEALSGTLRQRMEKHRSDPNCSVCHARMDALGFALENYDATGRWRDKDGDLPVDVEAELPGGKKLHGPRELKAVLLEEKDAFVRCFAEKMLTFALGRGLEYTDRQAVDEIQRAVEADGYRFGALVLAIVRSEPFLKRRGEPVKP
jgi:hypothetical protein